MTIPLTGAGGFYTRAGRVWAGLDDLNAARGGAATSRVLSGANLATRVNNEEADFAAGTGVQQVLDGLYGALTSVQGSMGSFFSDAQTRTQNLLKAMWSVDQGISASAPLAVLTNVDLPTALRTLISQMGAAAASVNASAPAAGAQTAVGTPLGNAVIVTSVKNPQGQLLAYAFPETLTFLCTADSQGSATSGSEPLSVRGAPAVADVFSHLWPGGSGASASVNAVDAAKFSTTANLLVNGDFETATTANILDNWTRLVGASGTDIFQAGSANAYTGSFALQFTGTAGALLDSVAQSFNTANSTSPDAGGTTAVLRPDTQYALSAWVKCSSTPAAGVLEFSLVDGTNTVINDDAGTANVVTKALTTVGATYVNVNGTFRTPAVLPAAQKFRVRLSTAITSGVSVYVDRVAFTPMTQVYAGGPFVAAFSGSARLILNDSWTVAVTNTFGTVQKWMERMFGMKALGLQIPQSGAPTVLDSVIA
jgi:hypothetical protein